MAKVFLSAGHGGSDPGAVAYGLKEKDINLQTLLSCKAELERHGVTVITSRTKDENDPVGQEVKEANASGADLAVSFHANAGGGHGFEAYYWSSSEKGKKLVEIATRHIAALRQEAHGNPVKSGNRLYFVKNTKMTAVLFESFFVDSDDRLIGDTVEEQRSFGAAYAKAILEYLGIGYKAGGAVVNSNGAFRVKTNTDMAVRTGAGMSYAKVTTASPGVYTVVEVKYNGTTPWGRLKSGAGWISIHPKYATRV